MRKSVLLRLHRWVVLVFAVPLIVMIATGLVLAVEPIVHNAAIAPGTLTAQRIEEILARHDPQSRARMLMLKPYDDRLLIAGVQAGAPLAISVSTGEVARGGFAWSSVFMTARRLHETLLLDLGWLVVMSTYAMLVVILLGVLMGLPRFRNTLSGWHRGTAWVLLPLVIGSPLTGLFIAYGVTFAPTSGASPSPAPTLREAVRVLQDTGHDLSGLVWLRPQGARMLARLSEGGEWRLYAVKRDSANLQPRMWPRLLHEGNFAGIWSGLLNVATSLALGGLLVTGLALWVKRKWVKRKLSRNVVGAA